LHGSHQKLEKTPGGYQGGSWGVHNCSPQRNQKNWVVVNIPIDHSSPKTKFKISTFKTAGSFLKTVDFFDLGLIFLQKKKKKWDW
jgi:hypothetical protein